MNLASFSSNRRHAIFRHNYLTKNLLLHHTTKGISKMNLRYTSLAACWACSTAWIQPPSTRNWKSSIEVSSRRPVETERSTTRLLSTRNSGVGVTSLKATVAPENVGRISALTPSGGSIGEGSIVSCLPGGLIAIKIDDSMDISVGTPEVEDLTNSVPQEKPKNVSPLGGDLIGRQVLFETGEVGMVVTHRPPMIFVYTDKDELAVVEGKVTILEGLASINISEDLKSTDCFGRPLDQDPSYEEAKSLKRAIFSPIPKVKDIALINKPMLTGITMFDALAPIGKGQNMLMVGHDINDMRQYVCDMLSVQAGTTKCVYAATSDHNAIKQKLSEAGVLENVVLVSSGLKDENNMIASSAEATVTSATACSIAEAFATQKGMDTLVIIDTLDQHKMLWDATTRVLVDVFGIDSVVKGDRDGGASSEMRAFFSSLIQRSAQYKAKYGGGSVTILLLTTIPKLSDGEDRVFEEKDFEGSPQKVKERIQLLLKRNIPLTADNLRKIQIPIPSDSEGNRRFALQHVDELISMTDGQIWLDEELEKAGRNPAMDYQRSVTRIGIGADTDSRADAPAIRQVVEGLRLDLSQALAMDGADIETNASKKQIRAANAWLLAMHQPSASGARKLSESCTALLAAAKGHLDDSVDSGILAGTNEGTTLMKELLGYVNAVAPDAMNEVDSSLDLSDDTKNKIEDAIKSYFKK